MVVLRLVVAGHVDHGKSTLIGQLMHALKALPDEKIEAVRASCAARGIAFEWAFVMDALRQERAQGITLECSHIVLKTADQSIVLIDAPGHHELLKNLITGAVDADGALLVVDASEGISEQTRRHVLLLQLFGIRSIILLINKMDKVSFSEARFNELKDAMIRYADAAGLSIIAAIPVVARDGDLMNAPSERMAWYRGENVIDAISKIKPRAGASDTPLRALVQDVVRRGDKRLIAVRIESGACQLSDELHALPTGSKAKLIAFESWPSSLKNIAEGGEAVVLELDQPILVERGMVLCHAQHQPMTSNRFRARIFWLGAAPLMVGTSCNIEIGTAETLAEITATLQRYDPETLELVAANGRVAYGEIADVLIRTRQVVALEDAPSALGRIVIRQNGMIVGGGLISTQGFTDLHALHQAPKSTHLQTSEAVISAAERTAKYGHSGLVVWLTGLSSSGKSTIANGVARRLFDKGYQVSLLDGDHLRAGLNRDLGFSASDRRENIRRAAEVAALMAESGLITIAAFISPTRDDRDLARAAAPSLFHLVHVKASLAACEKRDVKGLYAKARLGDIAQFTGISAPYDEPEDAELVIDTEAMSAQNAIEYLYRYIEKHAGLT